MANEDQLALLRQGVEAWNNWRFRNPDVEIDLRATASYSARAPRHEKRMLNSSPPERPWSGWRERSRSAQRRN